MNKFKKIVFVMLFILTFTLILIPLEVNASSVEYTGYFSETSTVEEDFKNLNLDRKTYYENLSTEYYDRSLVVATSEGYLNNEVIKIFVYIYNPTKLIRNNNIEVTMNDKVYNASYLNSDYSCNISKYILDYSSKEFTTKRDYKISEVKIDGVVHEQNSNATYKNSANGEDVNFEVKGLIPVQKSNAFTIHWAEDDLTLLEDFFGGYNTGVSVHILNFSFPTNFNVDEVLSVTIDAKYKKDIYSGDAGLLENWVTGGVVFPYEPEVITTYVNQRHVVNKGDYFNVYMNGKFTETNFKRLAKTKERFSAGDYAVLEMTNLEYEEYCKEYEYSLFMYDTQDARDLVSNGEYCGWRYEVVDAVILTMEVKKGGELINGYVVNQTETKIEDPIDNNPKNCPLGTEYVNGVCKRKVVEEDYAKIFEIIKKILGILVAVIFIGVILRIIKWLLRLFRR